MLRPRLLGFLRGSLGGAIKDGVGGAEKAWFAPDEFDRPNFGSAGPCRFEAEVLTERFFILRIFLFGDSALSTPGKIGNELENGSLRSFSSIIPFVGTECVLRALNDARGRNDSGDSGGELGDGSVSEDSMVEIVVVGDDSMESLKVEAESLRNRGELYWVLFWVLLTVLTVPLGASVAVLNLSFASALSGPFPNTDMNEGSDASSDCELVDTGILDS